MNLYLVQHAQARSKEEDPNRSLTDLGWAELKKTTSCIARYINIEIEFIFHSGKRRAQQTAESIAEYITPTRALESADGLAPNDDPSIWAERVKTLTGDTILVGHLPHLSKLAALLVTGDESKEIVAFHNSGMVCLNNDSGAWRVKWAIVPEILV